MPNGSDIKPRLHPCSIVRLYKKSDNIKLFHILSNCICKESIQSLIMLILMTLIAKYS